MTEKRTWNEERYGYDMEGSCWECGTPIRYFVDEDGTPRDITPMTDVRDPAFIRAVDAVFAAPGEFGPAKGYYGSDTGHFIDMLAAELSGGRNAAPDNHWQNQSG